MGRTGPFKRSRVKQTDRLDSVQRLGFRLPHRDRHSSGPKVALRLGANCPHTPRDRSTCAYLVLLRAEIARFNQCGALRRIG